MHLLLRLLMSIRNFYIFRPLPFDAQSDKGRKEKYLYARAFEQSLDFDTSCISA